jgi:hypothetical protein
LNFLIRRRLEADTGDALNIQAPGGGYFDTAAEKVTVKGDWRDGNSFFFHLPDLSKIPGIVSILRFRRGEIFTSGRSADRIVYLVSLLVGDDLFRSFSVKFRCDIM